MNRIRRAALTLATLTPLALLGAAQPAHADGLPVFANVTVDVVPYATYWNACGTGFVDDGTTVVGFWVFEVDGTRFDGVPIRHSAVVGGPTFTRRCFAIPRGGLGGTFEATLNFAAGGTSDVTATAAGVAAWGPIQDVAISVG